MNFDKGCQKQAFSQTKGANGLQFSLKAEVLTWKSVEKVKAAGDQRENWHHFEVLVSYEYHHALNGFK